MLRDMKIEVILNGYLVRDPETKMVLASSSTVTLVDDRFLIDTGSESVREELKEKLKGKKIEAVFHTHSHHDHCGNDELFSRAEILDLKEGTLNIDGVEFYVLPTPGHTPDSLSIFMRDDGPVYVAAGDAIPTKDNFVKWVPPFINYDREEAIRSMEKITERADVIIPGHGEPFSTGRKRPLRDDGEPTR